jgi:predicted ATPase
MINRARLLVARGDLPKEHVVIHFISRDHKGSHLTTIPLRDNGDFASEWPEGFFDERYQDTLALLEAKGQRT